MKKIGMIGHFGGDEVFLDGQTVKTKNLYRTLKEEYGEESIFCLDTYGYRKHCLGFFFRALKLIFSCENVILMTDENGIRVFIPLCSVLNVFRRRKLHYDVIGGWLPVFFKKHKLTAWFARSFTGIYVETSTMKKALEKMGFRNIILLPNFKYLNVLEDVQLNCSREEPYKLCTFSRVMKEKGIEDAVNAVRAVNEALGRTVYTLDIYGQVDSTQTQWFEKLQDAFPEYVRYGGLVPYDKSVEVLKDSFALLFPTRFFTEGIPGTIIDAYAAGVPVISAKWESFANVVDEGKTGFGYEFEDKKGLEELLFQLARSPQRATELKENCLRKAMDYTPERALQILQKRMEG